MGVACSLLLLADHISQNLNYPSLRSVNFRFYLAAPASEQSSLHEILKPCPSEVRGYIIKQELDFKS